MPNPATTAGRATQDERIPGLPVLPTGTNPATLTTPVYNPATDLTHQAPLGGPVPTTNRVPGGAKVVQYRDSRLFGVPAGALTLDRLDPLTIAPGTLATVDNPADTPLTVTKPPQQYVATVVPASTAGAVLVPRYLGAAAGDKVPVLWKEVATGGPVTSDPQVTAQLLGTDSASGEFLVLLSPNAPTTLNRYVLATYVVGPTPALLTGPLPAGTGIASRILRLPTSTLGQTLCLLDASGDPVPLQILEAKADENERFSLLTTVDPAAPTSALRGLVNFDYDYIGATGIWQLEAGKSIALVFGCNFRFSYDVQEGDVFGVYIDPTNPKTRIVLSTNGNGIDGQPTRRYTKGTLLVFRYKIYPSYIDASGTTIPPRPGLQTLLHTTPTPVNRRGPWEVDTYYLVGDLVTYQNALYLREVEGSDSGAFDPSKWAGGAASASAPSPVVGIVGGVETGYADLAAAFAARPSAIHLHADIEVNTSIGGQFAGKLFGNGHTVTIASGGVLRFSRYVSFYQLTTEGAGTLKIIGAGSPSGGTVPPAEECAQLTDCVFSAALELDAATSYQGLALRGNTVVENLTAGGGPVYLFELAQVSQPLPAGFTVYDLRPGAAVATGQVEVQLSSDSTNRVARIRLTKLRTLLAATAYASGNAQGYVLQVNTYQNGAWVAGAGRTAVADVQADLAALTAADYAAGAEMEIQVVPVTAASPAGLVLHWAGAESVSFLAANRTVRRTNSNAPPAGYAGITAFGDYEETDAAHILLSSGWQDGPGVQHSSGRCVYTTDPAQTITIKFWFTTACRFDLLALTDPSLGAFALTLDGVSYDTASQNIANTNAFRLFYTSGIIAPGEHTLTLHSVDNRQVLYDLIRFYAA
jgi:hypothetical protein